VYQEWLESLALADIDGALALTPTDARDDADFSETEIARLHKSTLTRLIESAIHDDIVSDEEDRALTQLVESLHLKHLESDPAMLPLFRSLAIARINDGRLPVIDSSSMILRRAEAMHAEFAAELLKEVTIRETRGGYGGFSFRVAKGVRFHAGQVRARSVVVGKGLVTDDLGVLAVSSTRSVFRGQKSTAEFRHDKLIDLGVFTDGIRFHVTNRKSAPLFKVESGEMVAAVINGAVQRLP
jgi:hypothetical protein